MKDDSNKKGCSAVLGRLSREKRREQITDSAARLFAEFGFTGTTTKEIAAAAGISEASLFQHFGTKAELYAAILDGKAQRICNQSWTDEIGEYAANNEDEKVFRAVALQVGEHCQRDPNFIRLMLYAALEKHENAQPFRRRFLYPVFEFLRDYIEKRKHEGFFQECSAEAAAFAFISTQIYFAMGKILFRSQMLTVNEEEALADFIKLSLDGLRAGAPQAKISKKDFCQNEESKDLQS